MIKSIKKYDKQYTNMLGIVNPYETFPYKIHAELPKFDIVAHRLNPKHNFVYDKLFIATSQSMSAGTLIEVADTTNFPIFIKPRYGHKTSSSKNCYKISSMDELKPYLTKKDMMWSEFVNAKESMTDFYLINGEIVYQLTYIYSEKQNGFADDWKYISPENKPPTEIVEWVNRYMVGYSGPVNVQYRSNKIIEVGLRFARSGMYIESTHNKQLITTINHAWETGIWSFKNVNEFTFKPYYSFKCWSPFPVICLIPQHIIDFIMKYNHCMPFYEYYFEPTGKKSVIFFQFLHENFEQGMKTKKLLEMYMTLISIFILLCILVSIYLLMTKKNYMYSLYLILLLFVMSLDNSIDVLCSQIINQKQFVV
jgi:hypothetical protein